MTYRELANKELADKIAKKHYRGPKQITNSHKECYDSALEMAECKDSQIRDILMTYTLWLNKRGFFREDLQCDSGHQIDTFLEMNDIKVDKGE